MANRWKRGRGRRDRRSERAAADRSDDPRDQTGSPPRGDDVPDDEMKARLDAVTSRFDRPPTADELRAAFGRKRSTGDEPPAQPADDFVSRYTTESLFAATVEDFPSAEPDPVVEDRSRTTGDYYYDPDDAWAVLGLEPGASWERISAAHRRLAKLHHPDRLLDATADQRAESEATMRDVNVAYSVLRRLTGH